ncbi:HEPN domain-containing protein [Candidatus Bathyarchaeota archaeon]|nr:HEPN domain-containing protein [Candidatus Bathyarchaeota archaeon]MBS7612862.1 HEPN domain-containing protein [Candidatus Bathyarchaeota archaeon]MBS7617555.1 HEPN domain-containing protein [Candidatus Bathyarchaeota archaeon]
MLGRFIRVVYTYQIARLIDFGGGWLLPSDYWKREALRWLEDAFEDLSVAEDLLRGGHHSASCFHSQQAAEKAVKAALYSNRVEAKGHSILELLESLGRVTGLRLEELYEDARLLDRHYAPTRYPNLHPSISLPSHKLYSREDAERCIGSARKIVNCMKRLLED